MVMLTLVSPAGGDTKVNSGSSTARTATVLATGNGEWLVHWYDSTLTWAVARFDSTGANIAPPAACQLAVFPSYSSLVWNGASVGWAFDHPTSNNSEIWFQLMGTDGSLQSTPLWVSPSSAGLSPCCPNLTWGEGEFVVAYESQTTMGSGEAIAVRRIDASGQAASNELTVRFAYIGPPRVARLPSAIAVAWGESKDIRAAVLDLNGNFLSPPTTYDTVPAGAFYLLEDAIPLPGRVAVTYAIAYGTMPSPPLQQVQIDTSGTLLYGPNNLGENLTRQSDNEVVKTAEGCAVAFRKPDGYDGNQFYLRRTAPDAIIGSSSIVGSDIPAAAGSRVDVDVAYQDRTYAMTWADNREDPNNSMNRDVYFGIVPASAMVACGHGPDPAAAPEVRLHYPEQPAAGSFVTIVPYAAGGFGANVGSGQIDLDEPDEVLTGPGPSAVYGPQVRSFGWDGTLQPKVNFYAYGTLRYGAKPRAGDLDSDTIDELLVTPGPGAVFGPHVRAFDFDGTQVQAMAKVSFFAYGTLKYGANAAGGDLDGDGYAEMATGPGPGVVFGAQIRGFEYDGTAVTAMGGVNAIVFAGASYGLHVGSGEIDADLYDELAAGMGPGPTQDTTIAVYDVVGGALAEKPGSRFVGLPNGSLGGAQVAMGRWWDRDLEEEILVAGGPIATNTEVWGHDTQPGSFDPLGSFESYPGGGYGVTLASVFPGF